MPFRDRRIGAADACFSRRSRAVSAVPPDTSTPLDATFAWSRFMAQNSGLKIQGSKFRAQNSLGRDSLDQVSLGQHPLAPTLLRGAAVLEPPFGVGPDLLW